MAAPVVQETVVLLHCPRCKRDLSKAWVTTLNKAFSPQVRAVEVVPGAHVVAVAVGAEGRKLFLRCPENLTRSLDLVADGPMGVRECEAFKAEVRGPVRKR